MANREVLQFGNPLLRAVSSDICDPRSPAVSQTMTDLRDTLFDLQRRHGRGGGLAAPQIGSLTKLVFVHARNRSFFLLNPEIVDRSDETFEVWDFCFSADASFVARIERHRRIVVKYQDEDGTSRLGEFEDYFSELLQHEIDHLHGKLFIDLIEDPGSITMMEEWSRG